PLEPFEFVRTIAVARIMMPKSYVRLSAGRETMNEQMQAMCFFAGANSLFYGEKLLTTPNPDANTDMALFGKRGIQPEHLVVQQSQPALAAVLASQAGQEQFYNAARLNMPLPASWGLRKALAEIADFGQY